MRHGRAANRSLDISDLHKKPNWLNVFAYALCFGLFAFSITREISSLQFSPDSASYLTAAQNLIRYRQLFVYSNYPSWSMEPVTEPYTEQPFGFPLYLSAFLLVLKQPFIAGVAAQVLAIVLLYGSVWALMRDFKMGPSFLAACFLAITLFRPVAFIFVNLWSEVLFIALTLWAIHFLIAARQGKKPMLNWILALGFGAAATATRAIGILTLGVFYLAILWKPGEFHRKNSRLSQIGLASVFILSPLAVWSLRNTLLYGSASMTHIVHGGFTLAALIQPLNFIFDLAGSTPFMRLMISGFAAVCLAAPFIANGLPENSHWHFEIKIKTVHFYSLILVALGFILIIAGLEADRLGFGGPPGIGLKQAILIDLGILSFIAAWLADTNIAERLRDLGKHYDRSWQQGLSGYGYLLLFSAGLCQLFGIIVLSFVTPFSKLEDRLLAPALTLLMLAALLGVHQLASLGSPRFSRGVFALAITLALASPAIFKEGILFQPGFHFPPEQQLWQELNTFPGINRVSHFYTDTDFTHQIYANRPQRVIADETVLQQDGYLDSLIAKGTCPFVLVEAESPMREVMDQVYKGSGLTRYDLMDKKFELYAQACLFAP